ncbi:hypothetical protein [Brevibacillus brevis]|uniref:hypothetical protein n=1 Tax=Brevibacillus brevis TaxID=1393 RepID=UPI0007D8C77E|nr:hypothetical protein [Brevibacillus brevis]
MSGINKKLSRSIEMIEIATKKLHEKKTGKKAETSSRVLANGTVKITVITHDIDTDDQFSAVMAAQYRLTDIYISDVMIQDNLPHRSIQVDNFSLDWLSAYENNGNYSVLGELELDVSAELYKHKMTVEDNVGNNTITILTKSNEYVILDCVGCSVTWHTARVA